MEGCSIHRGTIGASILQGLTVLIVDDHRDTVDMMLEYLAASGAIVVGAANAKAAPEVTTTHLLDAVLVDLRMPREDGRWFLRELRASQTASANVPVFAVSGERHDRLDPQSGFAGYFVKPVDLEALVSVLSALSRRPH